jgi:hypothetical protein
MTKLTKRLPETYPQKFTPQLDLPGAVHPQIGRRCRPRVRLQTNRLLNPHSGERHVAIHRVTASIAQAAFDPGGGARDAVAETVVVSDVAELRVVALEQPRVFQIVGL